MPTAPPVLLEVALNGVTSRERNPRVPRLPGEIADARGSSEVEVGDDSPE